MRKITRNAGRAFGLLLAAGMAIASLSSCQKKQAQVDLTFSEPHDGETVELITFADSTVVASAIINGNDALFRIEENDSVQFPVLAQFVMDGRVKGYYVIEEGKSMWTQPSSVTRGTKSNEQFNELMAELEKAEENEDFGELTAAAEKLYNENKENPLGLYFFVEWLKWADPAKVDSLLAAAPENFKTSRRAERYVKYAQLRAKTAAGKPYADFEGADARGNKINFSKYVEPGKVTLVDFMASWCPYCIKDMPKLKELAARYKNDGLNLVSVAVRDTPEATSGAVKKHGIDWNVVYDAQKRPYELYGFSGIPHYILIGPDGKILYRNESLKNIEQYLSEKYSE